MGQTNSSIADDSQLGGKGVYKSKSLRKQNHQDQSQDQSLLFKTHSPSNQNDLRSQLHQHFINDKMKNQRLAQGEPKKQKTVNLDKTQSTMKKRPSGQNNLETMPEADSEVLIKNSKQVTIVFGAKKEKQVDLTTKKVEQPLVSREITIQWDDSEGYTCGWLLSEFIRRTDSISIDQGLTTIAIRSRNGKHIALDYYLNQVEKPLQQIPANESLEAVQVSSSEISKLQANKSKSNALESLDYYIIEKVIGKGGFSKVMQVRHKITGQMYAMKTLRKDKIKLDNKVEQIMTERRILEKVSHPFIIKMHSAFQSKYYLHFVLEFCAGGELFFLLSKQRRFPEPIAKFFFFEILLGIEYLHNNNIMYRDLKPENILIDLDGHIRITDFGLSKDSFGKRERTSSFCGSPEYMSPEMLSADYHNRMVDFYSLGALLYEMLTGLPPFYSNNRDEMYFNIVNSELSFPNYLSAEAVKLLKGLLIKDPNRRLGSRFGIEEIKQQDFCKKFDWDLLKKKKLKNVPLKTSLKQENFDQEYTMLSPKLSLQSGDGRSDAPASITPISKYAIVKLEDDEIELMSPQHKQTKKHSVSLSLLEKKHHERTFSIDMFELRAINDEQLEGQHQIFQNIYSPSMVNLDKNKLKFEPESQVNEGQQSKPVNTEGLSPTFKNFQFQQKDFMCAPKQKPKEKSANTGAKGVQGKARPVHKKQHESPHLIRAQKAIQSQIGLQESGKAVFPGEKKITDESPRMEEGASFDEDEQEEDQEMNSHASCPSYYDLEVKSIQPEKIEQITSIPDSRINNEDIQITEIVIASYLNGQPTSTNAGIQETERKQTHNNDFQTTTTEDLRVKVTPLTKQKSKAKYLQGGSSSMNYNRCVSLTPTRKMKKQYNDQIKKLYQKFAYGADNDPSSQQKQMQRIQSSTNIGSNSNADNSNQSSFLVANALTFHNHFQARNGVFTAGDEESKMMSPQILSPRSNASSFGGPLQLHLTSNQQHQAKHRPLSKASYLNQNLNQNNVFKRKYNEVIGNVISERQRKVSQGGNTPINYKNTTTASSSTVMSKGSNSSIAKKTQNQSSKKGSFFLKNAAGTVIATAASGVSSSNASMNLQGSIKMQQISLRHNKLSQQQSQLNVNDFSLHQQNSKIGINESNPAYNEYFINLRGVQPLESSSRDDRLNYDSLNSQMEKGPTQDKIAAYINRANQKIQTEQSPVNQHELKQTLQVSRKPDQKRKSAQENSQVIKSKLRGAMSTDGNENSHVMTGTTATSKNVSGHSNAVAMRMKSGGDEEASRRNSPFRGTLHYELSSQKISSKKLSIDPMQVKQQQHLQQQIQQNKSRLEKKPPINNQTSRMISPNLFQQSRKSNPKIKSLITGCGFEDTSEHLLLSSRKNSNISGSNNSRAGACRDEILAHRKSSQQEAAMAESCSHYYVKETSSVICGSNGSAARFKRPQSNIRGTYINASTIAVAGSSSKKNTSQTNCKSQLNSHNTSESHSHHPQDSAKVQSSDDIDLGRMISNRAKEIKMKIIHSTGVNTQSASTFITKPSSSRIGAAGVSPKPDLRSKIGYLHQQPSAAAIDLKKKSGSNDPHMNSYIGLLEKASSYNILNEVLNNHKIQKTQGNDVKSFVDGNKLTSSLAQTGTLSKKF